MIRSLSTLITLLLLWANAEAQLSGQVVIANSEQPISGAIVSVEGSDLYAITNHQGSYQFEELAGDVTIVVSAVGFHQIKREIVLRKDELSNESFGLVEHIIDVEEVSILGFSNVGGYLGSIDLPPSTNYISTRQLQEFNTTDINKVLFNVPGVSFQEEDGYGLRPNIGIRGTGNERSAKITQMEDDILSAPAPYAAPSAYYFPTIGRMSAIEIRKGNSQIEYGPFTTGGVINLFSTPVPQEKIAATLQGNMGEFITRDFHGTIGGKLNEQLGFLVETFQYGSDGFKEVTNSENTGFYKQDYVGKLVWETKPGAALPQQLQAKVGFAFEDSDETYLGLTSQDFQENPFRRYVGSQLDNMKTDHQQLSLTHTISPTSNLSVKTSLYQNQFNRNWYKLDKVYNENGQSVGISNLLNNPAEFDTQFNVVTGLLDTQLPLLGVKANNRSYLSKGIQTNAKWNLEQNQFLQLGGRVHYDEMDRYQWVDGFGSENGSLFLTEAGTPGTESNRIESANAVATFATYEIEFCDFTVNAGVRYENITVNRDDFGKEDVERTGVNLSSRENDISEFIPGAGVRYQLNADQQLFAGVHKGFAPPGSTPGTEAEESVNYELGYRFVANNTFLNATVFYNDYGNLLGADNLSAGGAGTGDQFNGGEATTFGAEFGAQHYFVLNERDYLPFNLSYTYTNAQFDTSFSSEFDGWGSVQKGDELPYLAPQQLNASLGFTNNKISGIVRGSYVDDMRSVPGQGVRLPDEVINSRFLLNADARVMVRKHFFILGKINNLLNQTYVVSQRPSGLRPGMPRAASIGFDLTF